MKPFNRKEKQDIMLKFLESDAWYILKEEIERIRKGKLNSINVYSEDGETNKVFKCIGYKCALDDVLEIPERIRSTNENILKALASKVGL